MLFQNTGLLFTSCKKIKHPKKDLNLHKNYSETLIFPRLNFHHCVHKVQHLLLSWGRFILYSSALFSNALNLCSSLYVTSQVSYPYKTAGKTIVVPILISIPLVAVGNTYEILPKISKNSNIPNKPLALQTCAARCLLLYLSTISQPTCVFIRARVSEFRLFSLHSFHVCLLISKWRMLRSKEFALNFASSLTKLQLKPTEC